MNHIMIGSSGITRDWPSGIRTLNVNLKHDILILTSSKHRIKSLNNNKVPWPYNIIFQAFTHFKIPRDHMNLGGIFAVTKKSISFMTTKGLNQTVGRNKRNCQGYLFFVEMTTFKIYMKNMGKCYLTSMNGCGGSSSKIDLWSLSNLPHLWQF